MKDNGVAITILCKEGSLDENRVEELAEFFKEIAPKELSVERCIGINTPFFDHSALGVPDVRIEMLIVRNSLAGPEPFREKSLANIKDRILEANILPPGTKWDMIVEFGYFLKGAEIT